MGNLSDSMQSVVDDITTSTYRRRHQLQEIADETKRALNGWWSERQETTQVLREQFASGRAHRFAEEEARIEVARQLMDGIHRVSDQRRVSVSELRPNTRQLVNGWQSERQEMAQALREEFASNRTHRSAEKQARTEVARQLMDEIHRISDQRRVSVSELRSNAHNLVERFGLEHQDMANALREKLSSEDRSLEESVRKMVHELAADIRQARQIWTERLKNSLTPETVVAEEVVVERTEEVKRGPEMEAAPPLSVEEEILNIVAGHPEGIRLIDIGNELGIDWRTLIGASRSLVDEDKIEKIDNLYYPKGGEEEA